LSDRSHKIVHLITGLGSGGAEGMLYRLVTRMDRSRFENVVVSMLDGGTVGPRLQASGIPVHSLSLSATPTGVLRSANLMPLLRRLKPDVLQTWMYHADLLGLIAARVCGSPPILWNVRCSNVDMRSYPASTRWTLQILRRLSRQPDRIVINSKAGREHHEAMGYHPNRWELIANGIDLDMFRPDPQAGRQMRRQLGIPTDAIVIGMVARRNPMKDHGNLRHAAQILRARHPGVHFVLVGRGVEAGDTELSGTNMHLLGERFDLPALNASFDIATLSSADGEGFPNVIGEAMACAVPCAATDVGDSRWIIGDTGRVVPPRDSSALAAAWIEMIDMGSSRRAELGMRARERIAREFGLDRIVARYEDMYGEILDERQQ
jgi:glycosyltransferase involved in cell wall biosynthesis